jgi:hypothetical protein
VRVHYKPTGKPEPAEIRLRFRSGAPTDLAVQWVTKEVKNLLIPADSSPDIQLEYVAPQSMRLANILPEARFFASRVQVVADFPDGASKVVYDNYRWSPFLQGNNQIRKPILLPAGTKLRSIFSYVNDEYCQINENKKPEPVSSGPGPFDEMCRMHLLLIPE